MKKNILVFFVTLSSLHAMQRHPIPVAQTPLPPAPNTAGTIPIIKSIIHALEALSYQPYLTAHHNTYNWIRLTPKGQDMYFYLFTLCVEFEVELNSAMGTEFHDTLLNALKNIVTLCGAQYQDPTLHETILHICCKFTDHQRAASLAQVARNAGVPRDATDFAGLTALANAQNKRNKALIACLTPQQPKSAPGPGALAILVNWLLRRG